MPRPCPHALACTAALLLAAGVGCLPAFAPGLGGTKARRAVHSGLAPGAPRDTCMRCHESETQVLDRGADQSTTGAPLVADWMLDDARGCLDCHRLPTPERAGSTGARRGL